MISGDLTNLKHKGTQMKTTTHLLDELGGSCIIPNVHNYPRDTDYDGHNDYQSMIIVKGKED